MPPVTPSAINPIIDYPITRLPDHSMGFSSRSSASTCLVMTSWAATVVFLCSPTATRGVEPASSWRARAPAVTTNSNELGSLERSIMQMSLLKRGDDRFGAQPHPRQPGALTDDNAPETIDGGGDLVVDDDEIVLGEGGDLGARHVEASLDGRFAVLAAAAEPLLEDRERRRHHEHRAGFDALGAHF